MTRRFGMTPTQAELSDLDARVAAVLSRRADGAVHGDHQGASALEAVANPSEGNDREGLIELQSRIEQLKQTIETQQAELASLQAQKLSLQYGQGVVGAGERVFVNTEAANSSDVNGFAQASDDVQFTDVLEDSEELQSLQLTMLRGKLTDKLATTLQATKRYFVRSADIEEPAEVVVESQTTVPSNTAPSNTETCDIGSGSPQIISRKAPDNDLVAAAQWLAGLGRFDAAIEKLDQAILLQPEREAFIAAIQEGYILSREFDRAEPVWSPPIDKSTSTVDQIQPDQRASASDAIASPMDELASLEEGLDATPIELAQAYIELDDPAAARQILQVLAQKGNASERQLAQGMLASLAENLSA